MHSTVDRKSLDVDCSGVRHTTGEQEAGEKTTAAPAVIILRDTKQLGLSSCCLAMHVIFGTRLA